MSEPILTAAALKKMRDFDEGIIHLREATPVFVHRRKLLKALERVQKQLKAAAEDAHDFGCEPIGSEMQPLEKCWTKGCQANCQALRDTGWEVTYGKD